MGTYNPGMQETTLAAVDSDVHGIISKRTAELDAGVTEVTFAPGARWPNDLKDYAGTERSRTRPAPNAQGLGRHRMGCRVTGWAAPDPELGPGGATSR
jgi:hypothetical protein